VAGRRGSNGDYVGFADGEGTVACFQGPSAIAVTVDEHGKSSMIVTDSLNHCIRVISGKP
jgi:hypothetical protein